MVTGGTGRHLARMLAVGLVAGACAPKPPVRDDEGNVVAALLLPGGAVVSTVNYTISGNGITPGNPIAGTIDVSAPGITRATALVSGLAEGSYIVAMNATASDGQSCSGSTPFTVVRNQTALATVIILCNRMHQTGSVAIDGAIDQCPFITALSATTLDAEVGANIVVGVDATDLDGQTITYTWTNGTPATGTLAPTNAAVAGFRCTAVGTSQLSIAVSDGVCGDNLVNAIPLTCHPSTSTGTGGSGGGAGGGAGAGGAGGGDSAMAVVTGLAGPDFVAVGPDGIYVTEYDAGYVTRVRFDGSATTRIIGPGSAFSGIAIDGLDVYWASQSFGTVSRAPLSGGTPVTISPTLDQLVGVAVDATDVYMATSALGAVRRQPKAGGTNTVIATESFPIDVAVDDVNVYWTNYAPGTIRSMPKAGGPIVTLYTEGGAGNSANAYGLDVDATHVYWVRPHDGALLRVPKAGGSAELVGYPAPTAPSPWTLTDVAVDAQYIYVASYSSGRVVRLAKP